MTNFPNQDNSDQQIKIITRGNKQVFTTNQLSINTLILNKKNPELNGISFIYIKIYLISTGTDILSQSIVNPLLFIL